MNPLDRMDINTWKNNARELTNQIKGFQTLKQEYESNLKALNNQDIEDIYATLLEDIDEVCSQRNVHGGRRLKGHKKTMKSKRTRKHR
jgi:hypothetical protein